MFHILKYLFLLLLVCEATSSLLSSYLSLIKTIGTEFQLKNLVLVTDQAVTKHVYEQMHMDVQIINYKDLDKMKIFDKMPKCGVFVQIENEDKVGHFFKEVKQENDIDGTLFTKTHWFIFLSKDISLEMVFRFDSKVFIIQRINKDKNSYKILETFSIDQSSIITQVVGDYSTDYGLEMPEKNYLKRRQDLRSKTLRMIYYDDLGYCDALEPSIIHNNPRNLNWNEHNWSGFTPDIINSLADMLNFTYTLQFSRDGNWGSPNKNGSWNGGIRDILDNLADFGGGMFTASYIRSTVVDFTIPLVEAHNTFFLQNPKAALTWSSFLKPFSSSTWSVLGCMILICALTLASLARLAEEKNKKEFGLEKAFIYSFGAYCALAARRWSVTPVNIAVRIAFITILVCGCLVFWHWKAGLISNLSVVRYNPPFTSLDGVSTSDFKITLKKGTSRVDEFKLGKSSLKQDIWKSKLLPYKENFYNDKQDGINLILDDSSYVMYDNIDAIKLFPEYRRCDVMDIQNIISIDRFAFPFPKRGQFNDLINYGLKKMIESGELKKLQIKWGNPDQKCGGGKGRTLGFENTMPAFLIFVAGMSLSLFIIIFEMTIKKILGMDEAKQSWIDDEREEKQSYQLLSEQKEDQGSDTKKTVSQEKDKQKSPYFLPGLNKENKG